MCMKQLYKLLKFFELLKKLKTLLIYVNTIKVLVIREMYQFTTVNAEFCKNDNLSTLRQGKAT